MIPDFSTWYAEQRFKPGTRVRVCNKQRYHGAEGVVLSYNHVQKTLSICTDAWGPLHGRATSFEVIDAP